MRLKDKVAIITAAASGMGRAGAILFAKEGAKVIVADYNSKMGKETVEMIKAAGNEASFFQVDVSNIAQLKAMVDFTTATYGKLDIIWNHAGVPGPAGIEEVTEEDYDKAMDITLKSAFFACKFAIPEIRKQGKGSILFTASTSGVVGAPSSPFYGAAKGGIVNLTRSLAVKYGLENIRVNCVVPGPTKTPMWSGFVTRPGEEDSAERKAKFEAATLGAVPLGRMQEPEELANCALFLASDESSYVTGHILASDGGFLAR